jgi:hypothetical protein
VGEPNILSCLKCKLKFIIYWISMIPSYMFWNRFCEWLGKTNLCQNLRASRFKLFWGTPPPPPYSRTQILPPNHTIILSLICK